MPKIDITRTELVWPGKYDEDGNLAPPRRVNLPFQVIERVNETRATRQQREEEKKGHVGTLFDYWQEEKAQTTEPGDGWRNKLIWGDNLYVMGSLLENFAGKIDLIYIDPPFATGADFSVNAEIGEGGIEISKEHSVIEEKIYRDTWGKGFDSYLNMLYPRIMLFKDLLSQNGVIYVHCDKRLNYFIRAMLDEVMGTQNFRNEIIWCYRGGGTPDKDFAEKHDTIFRYSNSENYYFDVDPVRIPYSSASTERLQHKANVFRGEKVYTNYQPNELGKHPEDWWTIQPIMPSEKQERNISYYPTQKPVELLQRIIDSSVPPNGIVFDAFCGSGTTLVVAEGLRVLRDENNTKSLGFSEFHRRWLGCDISRFSIHVSRKRLMEIPDCKPFEILNLGRYERQVWQGVTFDGQKQTQQMLIFEYLKFILELYGAQPLAGTQALHGKKGSAVVHVGAVDAPVTIDEVIVCLAECKQMGQKELHILGWEWEMGLANLMVDEARGQGVKLLMLTIPREVMEQQAVEKGDIHFYELAYLEPKIHTKGRSVTVELADFIIPNNDLIPLEVRQKIKKWSDYVDYWAVDWDFQNDTFVNGWTSYRTRRDRALKLKSEAHEYPAAGSYRIVVKVIDIFGNDTSQAYEVEVA